MTVAAWYGSVYFYQDIDFRGDLYPVDLSDTQKCFNMHCFDDKVSSAKWVGLPTAGQIHGKSHIAFYTSKDCVGPHIHLPTDAFINDKRDNFPANLRKYAMNDKLSSFMIWETSEKSTNGITTTCKCDVAAETKGSVYFYTDVNFSGTLFPVDVSQSNKCYSLCEFKDASSVKWIGRFPTTGYTDGKAQIAFYTEKTCFGPHIHFPIEFQNNVIANATVKDLRQYNINNDISSFMIWETSENIENGAQTKCPWTT
ncbi:hypothetical protein PF004_g13737 [Phytophthora fragariae]|uniref:Uncharacterized protein n=1 Tax=Phytophthora fragariae TaxID=53985 RepID=A0A6G0NRB1_9STRA|nr:hypothetical protein PF004_g13737 [Phytophthora fragariae]